MILEKISKHPRWCEVAEGIFQAEASQRDRARSAGSELLQVSYAQSANALASTGIEHMRACPECRALEDGNAVAPDAPVALAIESEVFGNQTEPAVSARHLHVTLGIGKDFTNWIKAQIERARLMQGRDFLLADLGERTGRGGHNRTDYVLTLDSAKHVAMLSGTERGYRVREYFIEAEKRYRSSLPSVHALLSDPAALREMLAAMAGETATSRARIAELEPKARFHDAVANAAGDHTLQEAAKVLGWGPVNLFRELRRRKVLLDGNMPYQNHINAGRFRVIEGHYRHKEDERAYTRTLVTPKGLTWLHSILSGEEAVAA